MWNELWFQSLYNKFNSVFYVSVGNNRRCQSGYKDRGYFLGVIESFDLLTRTINIHFRSICFDRKHFLENNSVFYCVCVCVFSGDLGNSVENIYNVDFICVSLLSMWHSRNCFQLYWAIENVFRLLVRGQTTRKCRKHSVWSSFLAKNTADMVVYW